MTSTTRNKKMRNANFAARIIAREVALIAKLINVADFPHFYRVYREIPLRCTLDFICEATLSQLDLRSNGELSKSLYPGVIIFLWTRPTRC